MNKWVLVLLLGVQNGWAQPQVITLGADQSVKSFQMNQEVMVPILKTESYTATCESRSCQNTVVGTSCTQVGGHYNSNGIQCDAHGKNCHSGGHVVESGSSSHCTPVTRESCMTNSYPCTKTQSVQVGESQKNFQHNVTMSLDPSFVVTDSSIAIQVNQNQSDLGLSLLGTFEGALIGYEKSSVSIMDNDTQMQIADQISFRKIMSMSALKKFKSSSIQSLKLDQSSVSFIVHNAAEVQKNIKISVNLIQHHFLWSATILSGEIKASDVAYSVEGADVKGVINLAKLLSDTDGVNLVAGKYSLSLEVSLDVTGDHVINLQAFSSDLKSSLSGSLNKVHVN